MKTLSRILLSVLVLACGVLLPAAAGWTAVSPPLDRLLARHGFDAEDVGLLLFDPTNGNPLAAHRADEPRIPASTTKAVMMLAALQILGADYRFTTDLLASGEVQSGVLYGNLYLRGGGDPTLATEDLREFVNALRRVGITRVRGEFAFDESFLAPTQQIDTRQPIAASYNPGLSALSLNYNRILLRWQRRSSTAPFITTVLSPADGGAVRLREIGTGLLSSRVDRRIKFLYAGAEMDRWLLSPFLGKKGGAILPVKANSGHVAALLFRRLCQQHGIALPLPRPATVPAHAALLAAHQSRALSAIIEGVLHYSNNLSAELIGQVAARKLSGRPLSLPQSAAVLTDWYRKRLPDTNWHGFLSLNHSGLSSASRHSPHQMAAILRYGWALKGSGIDFFELLPSPPWERTNGRRSGTVRAKSGTMNYADGLAGFLTTQSGRQLGFVLLLTDFAKRTAFDAALDVRIAAAPPAARDWTARAKKFEQALVTSWVRQY